MNIFFIKYKKKKIELNPRLNEWNLFRKKGKEFRTVDYELQINKKYIKKEVNEGSEKKNRRIEYKTISEKKKDKISECN